MRVTSLRDDEQRRSVRITARDREQRGVTQMERKHVIYTVLVYLVYIMLYIDIYKCIYVYTLYIIYIQWERIIIIIIQKIVEWERDGERRWRRYTRHLGFIID